VRPAKIQQFYIYVNNIGTVIVFCKNKGRYTLATKSNWTQSTLSKDDRVALTCTHWWQSRKDVWHSGDKNHFRRSLNWVEHVQLWQQCRPWQAVKFERWHSRVQCPTRHTIIISGTTLWVVWPNQQRQHWRTMVSQPGQRPIPLCSAH